MTMTKFEMFKEMLRLQDETNQQVDLNWRARKFNFKTAILVETGEMLDHYGYKWWGAKKEPDWDQIRMELVDIWHFYLSELLVQKNLGENLESMAPRFDVLWRNDEHFEGRSQEFLGHILHGSNYSALGVFLILCANANLSFEHLYKLYIGKAALNRFRWKNSYGDGYKKIWSDGLEDNEHLTLILNETNEVSSLEALIQKISEKYIAVNDC